MHPTVHAFVSAAEIGDVPKMHELIDWPTSGVARFVASLNDIPETRRAGLARQGLTEMFALAHGHEPYQLFANLALRLTNKPVAIRLDRSGVEALVEAARPEPLLPAGVPDDIVQTVDRLRIRINSIAEAYRFNYRTSDTVGLGVLPEESRLTLVRRLRSVASRSWRVPR